VSEAISSPLEDPLPETHESLIYLQEAISIKDRPHVR